MVRISKREVKKIRKIKRATKIAMKNKKKTETNENKLMFKSTISRILNANKRFSSSYCFRKDNFA